MLVFFFFPSKGLRIQEKNEGILLVFVDREAPVGVPPFGCSPQPGSQTFVFPNSISKPRLCRCPRYPWCL